jgi:hypothetical protein
MPPPPMTFAEPATCWPGGAFHPAGEDANSPLYPTDPSARYATTRQRTYTSLLVGLFRVTRQQLLVGGGSGRSIAVTCTSGTGELPACWQPGRSGIIARSQIERVSFKVPSSTRTYVEEGSPRWNQDQCPADGPENVALEQKRHPRFSRRHSRRHRRFGASVFWLSCEGPGRDPAAQARRAPNAPAPARRQEPSGPDGGCNAGIVAPNASGLCLP